MTPDTLLILKGGCTMANMSKKGIKNYTIELAAEELKELEKARNMPITFDEDCPETTPEKAVKFKRVNPPKMVVG